MIWNKASDGYIECTDYRTHLIIEVGTVAKFPDLEEDDSTYAMMWHITYHYNTWKYVEYIDLKNISESDIKNHAERMYKRVESIIPEALK